MKSGVLGVGENYIEGTVPTEIGNLDNLGKVFPSLNATVVGYTMLRCSLNLDISSTSIVL